jgi:hypothetical protein
MLVAPTDIALSPSSIAENQPSGSTVGTLSTTDPDIGDSFGYALVGGTGDTDNAAFTIDGNALKTTAAFNYEAKSSYSIRIRSTDAGALSTDKIFTITVTNANEAPTDITLSTSSIAENAGVNAVVGTLATTDSDAGNTFTYALVFGTGDTDNGSFNISGNQLRATTSLDFETKTSYSIRVQSKDQGDLVVEKQFTITVTNVAETPGTPDLLADTDTGSNSDDRTKNASPTFTGTVEPNAYVEIYDGPILLGLVSAASSGTWTFVMATAGTLSGEGDHFIKARASFDKVAWSGYSTALKVTLDTVPPTAPQTPVLDPLSDTGPTDNKTTVTTPTLKVTAQDVSAQVIAGVTIVLTQGTTVIPLVATQVAGTDIWQATPTSPLATGDWTVTAKATDVAGNESGSSPALGLKILAVLSAPAAVDLVAAADSGVSDIDDVTNVQKPTFNVTAPVGTTKVELFRGVTPMGLATLAADGVTWSLALTEPLADGNYSITAQVTDAAGETSPKSSPLALKIDTVAPTLQTLAAVTPSPRSTPVSSIESTFSETVFRVAATAFQLKYNPGNFNRSLVLAAATTTPSTPVTPVGTTAQGASNWTLGNLETLTNASGTFTLALDKTGSTVVIDQAGNPVTYSDTPSRQWTTDVTSPRIASIALSPASQQPRSTAVTSATITFSESVTGVDKSDFELLLDDVSVPFTVAVSLSGSGSTYTLSGLGGLTATQGTYVLRSKAAGSGIEDTLGNDFGLDGSVSWQMDTQAPTGAFDAVATPRGSALQSIGLTFSEPVTGVEKTDFTLTRNGTPVSLANASLTPATGPSAAYALTGLGSLTGADGSYVLTLSRNAGSPIKDGAGNAMTADISRSWSVDGAVPTATIALAPVAGTSRKSAVTAATITFSLPVTGVDVADFRLNGVVPAGATVTGAGTTWTLGDLGPLTAAEGAYVLTLVAAGSGIARASGPATPLAANAAASWTMDLSAPKVELAVVGRALSAGSTTFTLQALFSEPVSGFVLGDITVSSGGLASAPTPVGTDGRVYQFDVTVSPAPRDPVAVSIAANQVQDAALNGNSASPSLKLVTDFAGPNVTLTSVTSASNQPSFTVTATFSEDVANFTAGDVTLTNGVVTSVTPGSGKVFSIAITPTADGLVGVSIGANKATDASGNGNTPSNNLTVRIDRAAPTVAISSLSGTLSRASELRFAATFSEPVSGVTASDLTVLNGTVSAVQGTGSNYTFVVTPTKDGNVTVGLPAGIAGDVAGNLNTVSLPATVTVKSDRTPPTVRVAASGGGGTITFSEPVTGFDLADLRLFRDGASVALNGVTLSPASGPAATYTLSGLASLVTAQGRYTLQLVAAGSNIVDLAGNPLLVTAANVADTTASFSVDTTQPVAAISTGSPVVRVAVDKATISFSEPVTGVGIADFELRRNGFVVPLTGVSLSPATGPSAAYALTGLATLADTEAAYSLRLRALGSGIVDGSGNPLRNDAVGTWVVDNTAPTAAVGPVSPAIRTTPVSTVPITFSEPVIGLDAGDFTLRRDGVVVQLTGATLTPVGTGGRDFVLGGLGTLTRVAGSYELRMRSANTGIADRAGNPLAAEAFAGWANTAAPSTGSVTASFLPVSPNPRVTAVDAVTVAFTVPVTGVDASDFVLTRTSAGSTTTLGGFAVTGSGGQRVLTGLTALTAAPGSYELRLRASGSGIATAAGVALKTDAVAAWTTLASTNVAPTATLTPTPPAEPGTAVDTVAIDFSEPVTGMSLAALRLARNGVPINLNGAVLTGSGTSYVLRGLAPIATAAGGYRLTVVAAGSSVRDSAGVGMAVDASTTWNVATVTLRAAFLGIEAVRTAPVSSAQVRFSSLVKGVDLNDFELERDGELLPLYGVTVTGSGGAWVIGNLAPLQSQKGTYTLRLRAYNGDITTGTGMVLAEDASVTWTII